jgi:hypothetical protein
MKKFNTIFGFIFVLFALLQYNDPDPYLWIPIYGFAALVCILNARGKYDFFTHAAAIVFCLGFSLKLLFVKEGVIDWYSRHNAENLVQSMKATKPWIENAREFGGLLIIMVVVIINIFLHKKAGAK